MAVSGHWHVASGITGYGPDGSDGFASADTPESLADAIRWELSIWAEREMESADGAADDGDFESAWKLRKSADRIEILRANLDNERVKAPLYVNDRAAWHATILRTVETEFSTPLLVNEGRTGVYVWTCIDSTCEHLD
jgi:hypothetical protein